MRGAPMWRNVYRYAAEDPVTCSGDECRTKTFKYIRVKSVLSRKAESAGETPDVRTDCAEFKPVEMRHWAPHETGSPVTCSGEEVTYHKVHVPTHTHTHTLVILHIGE